MSARRSSAPARPERWGWHRLDERSARLVVERAGISAGDLVVDLGAGTGALTAALADVGARVIAVELHPERLAELRARFAGHPVTVVRADVRQLRWPGRPFRVVANPPWSAAEEIRSALLRAPQLVRADLVLPRWLVRRWAVASPRIGIGPSLRAEAFTPAAPTGAAVAVIAGRAVDQRAARATAARVSRPPRRSPRPRSRHTTGGRGGPPRRPSSRPA